MKIRFIIIILLLISVYSCRDETSKIVTLKVAAHKVEWIPPYGEGSTMGYNVTDYSDNRQFVIIHIHGFDEVFQEGYEYVIKVRVVEQKKSIADQLFGDYYLIKIISREKVEEDKKDEKTI